MHLMQVPTSASVLHGYCNRYVCAEAAAFFITFEGTYSGVIVLLKFLAAMYLSCM